MKVPEKCYSIIEKSLSENGFIGKVSKENPVHLSRHYLDTKRLKEQILLLESFTPLEGMFLEVGSGYGGLVTYLNTLADKKLIAYGIEPSADAYEATLSCTKILSKSNKIKSKFVAAAGELLPFKSNIFDIVYSTSVLEHVKSPNKVISESIRVLKPGGILQFVIPNYGSWWEGHYGLILIPHLPKNLFKIYVKLFGRDPEYIDTLKFIKKKQIERILLPFRESIEVLSWGEKIWEERVRKINFSEWASLGTLKKYVRWIHRLKLTLIVIWLGKKLHWETPFVLTLIKKQRAE